MDSRNELIKLAAQVILEREAGETAMLEGMRKEALYSAATGLNINRQLWLKAFLNRAKRLGEADRAGKSLSLKDALLTPLSKYIGHRDSSRGNIKLYLEKLEKLFSQPVTSRVPVEGYDSLMAKYINAMLTGKTPNRRVAGRLRTMAHDAFLDVDQFWGNQKHFVDLIDKAVPIKRGLTRNLFR